ncbi:unnamed protein product [Ranitomeya imitator]|uniref:Uncharacterized protein n=1 Tax=Ranitomeya imitator TaxID=111125 RepID=A0ABN9KSV5_9NEOB|nr:unnamed protein product [Ranitomeya imitator]
MKMGGPGPDRDAHRTGPQRDRPPSQLPAAYMERNTDNVSCSSSAAYTDNGAHEQRCISKARGCKIFQPLQMDLHRWTLQIFGRQGEAVNDYG